MNTYDDIVQQLNSLYQEQISLTQKISALKTRIQCLSSEVVQARENLLIWHKQHPHITANDTPPFIRIQKKEMMENTF